MNNTLKLGNVEIPIVVIVLFVSCWILILVFWIIRNNKDKNC